MRFIVLPIKVKPGEQQDLTSDEYEGKHDQRGRVWNIFIQYRPVSDGKPMMITKAPVLKVECPSTGL